jgi:hypothetical protein
MTKTQKIIAGLGLGLVCGVVLVSAVSKSDKNASGQPDTSVLAQNDWAQTQTASEQVQPPAAPAAAPVIADGPKIAAISEGPDGKEVLPTDGKEVLPTDGKETLPPVSEMLPSGSSVDPSNGGPPTEFLNPNKSHSNNQLLAPPNPQNVAGPVVSPETR